MSSHNHLAAISRASQHARRAHDGRVRFVKAKLLGSGEYLMCHVDGFKVSAPECACVRLIAVRASTSCATWTASQLGRLHSLDGFTAWTASQLGRLHSGAVLSRPSPPQHASAHHGASTLSPPFLPQVEYSLLTESETLAALGQGSFVTR